MYSLSLMRLFDAQEGVPKLMAEPACGSGLRLTELLRLRVKDVNVDLDWPLEKFDSLPRMFWT
jgi:integrase